MKTYTQRIIELHNDYKADEFVTKMSDIRKIEKALGLCDMDELELRNIRDMVVMFYTIEMNDHRDDFEVWRQLNSNMTSITSVIDNMIWAKGFEI